MSNLSEQYRKQWQWRDWDKALSLCPLEAGHEILDLGCGPGDIAKELIRRGAKVTGIDSSDELLATAKQNCPEGDFQKHDLRFLQLNRKFDGIWSSFSAAYMQDFEDVLDDWITHLKPTGWICLVEATDVFNHAPMNAEDKKEIEKFFSQSARDGRYDFRVGDRFPDLLEERDFSVLTVYLKDDELCFQGPASTDVLTAWKQRLDRMKALQAYLGTQFPGFRQRFIDTLSVDSHKSNCRVICSVGARG